MRQYPVIIVGGGPVGLCTAIGLRRLGIQCLLVERHASTSLFPKGRGISVRTMEIFRRWKFEHTVREAGLPPDQSLFIYTGETLLSEEFERFGRTEAQLSIPSPTSQLICSQDVLEPILKKQAVELGADVRFSTEAVSLAQDEDGVTVELCDAGGTSWSARCAYLVGADGAHSGVRQRLDIQMRGPGAVDTQSISILVEADLRDRVADRQSALYFVRRPAPGSLFAAVDNDRRWLLITRYSEEPPGGFAPEVCIELVRDAVGDRALDALFVGHQLWQPTALVADRFRRGRVFLAGDAAHLTTPAGALGMNCGIADAHNLAWKLAAVIDGWAGSSLLDTYEPERRPVAHWCMQTSVDLRAEPEGPRRAGLFGVVLGYAYESSAVIGDGTDPPAPEDPVRTYVPTSRPGHRAPHVWLENNERQRSTLDLFGDGFVVLHGVDADVRGVRAAAADLAIPLRSYSVGSGGEIRDADGGVRSTYALGAKDAVLVRPDGHVAWRGDPSIGIADALAAVVGRRGGGDRADSSSASNASSSSHKRSSKP